MNRNRFGFKVTWEAKPKEYNIPIKLLWRQGIYSSYMEATDLHIFLFKGIQRAPEPRPISGVKLYTYAPGIYVSGEACGTGGFDLGILADSVKKDPSNRTVDPASYLHSH